MKPLFFYLRRGRYYNDDPPNMIMCCATALYEDERSQEYVIGQYSKWYPRCQFRLVPTSCVRNVYPNKEWVVNEEQPWPISWRDVQ
jgi:hypothetical protein